MCRKRLSSPCCRSELIGSAWVAIVPGQKCIKKSVVELIQFYPAFTSHIFSYNVFKKVGKNGEKRRKKVLGFAKFGIDRCGDRCGR